MPLHKMSTDLAGIGMQQARSSIGNTFKRPCHHAQHHAKVSHAEVVLVLQVDKLAFICTYTCCQLSVLQPAEPCQILMLCRLVIVKDA